MGTFKRSTRGIALALSLVQSGGVGLFSGWALAVEPDEGGPGVRLDASMPDIPGAIAVSDQQRVMEALFSCPGVAQQQIGNAAAGLVNGVVSLSEGSVSNGASTMANGLTLGTSDQPCTTPTGLPLVPEDLSCKSPQLLSGGKFDPAKLRRFRQAIEAQLRPLQCREQRISGIMAEAQCLTEGMHQLESQVGQLNQMYSENIQRMNKDMSAIAEVEGDYQAQMAEAQSRLNSIEGSATTGIAQAAKELGDALSGIENEIAAARANASAVKQQRKSYEEQLSRARMGYAAQCVQSSRNSEYRCVKNGPVVSAMEHLRCIYEQRGQVSSGTGGARVESDQNMVRESAGRTAQLDSVMERIFADISSPEPPADAAAASKAGEPRANSYLVNPQQLLVRYGGELDALSSGGVDVSGFVMGLFTSCYRRASSSVTKALDGADNRWAVTATQITAMEEQSRATIQAQIDRYAAMYERATGALTLTSQPLNVAACRAGSIDNATACLGEIREVLNGVVRGNNQWGKVALTISGTNNQRNVNFTCNGLQGCARDLDRLIRNRTRHLTQLAGVKNQYVSTSRQNLTNFTNQMRQSAQPAIAKMRSRMQLIARALGAAGVKDVQLDLTPMDRTELAPAEGIPEVPGDVMALIAGGPNGIPRVDANFFVGLSGQLSEARSQLAEEKSRVQASSNNLDGLMGQCRDEAAAALADAITSMSEGNCNRRGNFCTQSPMRGLMETLRGVGGSASSIFGAADAVGGLESGMAGVCTGEAGARAPSTAERGCLDAFGRMLSQGWQLPEPRTPTPHTAAEAAVLVQAITPPANMESTAETQARAALVTACGSSTVGEMASVTACGSALRRARGAAETIRSIEEGDTDASSANGD